MTNIQTHFRTYVRTSVRTILALCVLSAGPVFAQGVVGEVRIHGNHTTPDGDVLAIVGDVVGKPATDQLIAEIDARLKKSGRFDGVEVRKRFRSIENPDDILLMVVVDEVPGIDPLDLTPSPMKKFWSSGMFMPILHSEDGYGFTYGGCVSFVDRLGPRSRVSVPLTWGGERQARVQLERSFKAGPIERVSGEFGIQRRNNFSAGLLFKSGSLPAAHHILMPVRIKKAPNTYSTQWNSESNQPPTKIMTVRNTMAPMMPIISTRF